MPRLRPTPAQLLLYGLAVTLLVFAAPCRGELLLLAAVNAPPGFIVGARRYPVLVALFFLSIIGTMINSIILANHGPPVASVGPLTIRRGAVDATINITLRFMALSGVSLLFAGTVRPREAVRSLEEELGLPKGVAFSVAFGLRLLSLAQSDLSEIMAVRRMRGAPRIPLRPRDVESLLAPMLSIMLERARWVGIAAELRGFQLRGRRPLRLVPTVGGVVLFVLLVLQVLGLVLCC